MELEPTYEKVEATAEDIIAILRTLWDRAEDIPASPLTRVCFHAVVLLSALGGFRPGAVLNLLYKDFTPAVVRDPDSLNKCKLMITVTVKRNKIKECTRTTRNKNNAL